MCDNTKNPVSKPKTCKCGDTCKVEEKRDKKAVDFVFPTKKEEAV